MTDNEKVKRVVDFYTEIENHIEKGDTVDGTPMPFTRLKNKFGFRGGEVTLWSGFNGHKKSMFIAFLTVHFLRFQDKVCMASFEMKPISTIKRMTADNPGLGIRG